MRFENLPTPTRQEVQQALLPGEEVRYVTRSGISYVAVLLKGNRKTLVFCVGLHAIILAFAVMAVWDVLAGTKPVSSLVSVYSVLLILILVGRSCLSGTFGVAQAVRRSWYLVTTYRVMIVRPGRRIFAWPLESDTIDHVEYMADGSGSLYFRPVSKYEIEWASSCFAFIPEVHRVESLINESSGHIPLILEVELPDLEIRTQEPDYYERLIENLEPGEQVQWLGRSLPLRLAQTRRERLGFWCWGLVSFTGSVCSCIAAADNSWMWMMAILYLAISVFFLLMLQGADKSVYAITNKRVCYVSDSDVLSFSRDVVSVGYHPNGVVDIQLKSDNGILQYIHSVSTMLPVLILLGKHTFPAAAE